MASVTPESQMLREGYMEMERSRDFNKGKLEQDCK